MQTTHLDGPDQTLPDNQDQVFSAFQLNKNMGESSAAAMLKHRIQSPMRERSALMIQMLQRPIQERLRKALLPLLMGMEMELRIRTRKMEQKCKGVVPTKRMEKLKRRRKMRRKMIAKPMNFFPSG